MKTFLVILFFYVIPFIASYCSARKCLKEFGEEPELIYMVMVILPCANIFVAVILCTFIMMSQSNNIARKFFLIKDEKAK